MTPVIDSPRSFRAPEARELRFRLYRELAHGLAAASEPAAAVLESGTDSLAVEVTVSPGRLTDLLLSAPAYAEIARGVHVAAPTDNRAGLPNRVWELAPVASPAPPAPPPLVVEPPRRIDLLGTDGSLDTQTFWLSGRPDGRLWAGRRIRYAAGSEDELDRRARGVAERAAASWGSSTGVLCRGWERPRRGGSWALAAPASLRRRSWVAVPLAAMERTAEPAPLAETAPAISEEGHTVVLGSSGAGKTTYLAAEAARAVRAGAGLLVVDLHGDLAPSVVERLTPEERCRLVCVDAGQRPVVGISAWVGREGPAAAHLVAAIKRLSPDGGELYWGFRLERLFDGFARLVHETGGTLGDLYGLLTDADRREAARLATRDRELARFLDELGPIVRRNPEFLWGAAARLAKVALVPELRELLAPEHDGVPVERVLERGGILLVRLPFAVLGPEAAGFAGSLILARAYLGALARLRPGGVSRPLAIVLDEVQGLSPRLVAEMLAEGRKFGVRVIVASQYPERLAPELRAAAAGVGRGVLAFRVPRASAAIVGAWLGLSPIEAERFLPDLPTGQGVTRMAGSGELRSVSSQPVDLRGLEQAWSTAVAESRTAFPGSDTGDAVAPDEVDERLLLAVLAREERGLTTPADQLAAEAAALPGPSLDPALVEVRRPTLERTGLLCQRADGLHLTPAGERRLGLRSTTGASCESAEHRALLVRAFRLFARHGHRLEIVRQGRYDTTLPDARFVQLTERERSATPAQLALSLEALRRGWAWRFFGGLDVHVEAEVSGALRAARIRHGFEKARRRGAYALFLVGDAARAARVRRALAQAGAGRDRAQVWTLGPRDLGGAIRREGE